MANRHLSRSIVLQTLFEWDFLFLGKKNDDSSNNQIKEILNRNLKEFAPGLEDDHFVSTLLDEVLKKRKEIDEIIEKAAPDWPIDKISIVDRNILRIGLTELLFSDRMQVPPKVAINEAIELAKTFGGENSGKFVNGVLGAVYKEIGEPDKGHASNKKTKADSKEPLDINLLPIENLGGALVYTKKPTSVGGGEDTLFALVHDVFGYWTLSKGKVEIDENIKEGTKRKIKEEIGLDITIEEKLGENEYVATHPSKGKSLKRVVYFLAYSEYKELTLEESGGLDGARWFGMNEIPGLRIYNDIVPLISKTVEILNSRK
ncbi:transcription antitermination factor NusB [Candidatus Nomurabacteria bacterium RIFCSPHIGHO2_12_FULL_37_29]|uniref:Transcription antitermination protein NusB n=2 Tax=Candidatus Nomuraibacteriota TaxID=1752729 RepID=A0A1F6Y7E7_9BACT|nr:MAG: transcription antitermination factor NusB [Candidatus Nomurabacteria bacterium RIFCSPHIGHO2_01_FULL_37_110]OGI79479.1 MAG: transcription antitermination factor NusB [Candidatus Nomurabacteria bacterium RIFCSPHIGHO2_12_FULL_37_29]OGI85284.1 MAG: transcription antitermination factor NusB [Candidatus Nomurabacteria bacterium RIFCSPLOWO2_01_FULL_37_49]OGJ02298.1 MAG: transcription antitermination factor NusB [Candidatus Nomurabacteria bacterium RIFCSPLOWO2_12_FULL_37_8]